MSPAPAPHGCLLIVVQSSASMGKPLPAHGGAPKLEVACNLASETAAELITRHEAGDLAGARWDVGVVAIFDGDEGSEVVPLLALADGDDPFVPLERLARDGHWPYLITPPPRGYRPRPLAHAARLVSAWAYRHERILQPVV